MELKFFNKTIKTCNILGKNIIIIIISIICFYNLDIIEKYILDIDKKKRLYRILNTHDKNTLKDCGKKLRDKRFSLEQFLSNCLTPQAVEKLHSKFNMESSRCETNADVRDLEDPRNATPDIRITNSHGINHWDSVAGGRELQQIRNQELDETINNVVESVIESPFFQINNSTARSHEQKKTSKIQLPKFKFKSVLDDQDDDDDDFDTPTPTPKISKINPFLSLWSILRIVHHWLYQSRQYQQQQQYHLVNYQKT